MIDNEIPPPPPKPEPLQIRYIKEGSFTQRDDLILAFLPLFVLVVSLLYELIK